MNREQKNYKRLLLQAILAVLMTFSSLSIASLEKKSLASAIEGQDASLLPLYSQATAKWLWLDVYQARLFVDFSNEQKSIGLLQNKLLQDGVPVKLQLCYKQSITAEQIIEAAEESLSEQKMSLSLAKEVERLHAQYQSVVQGDCYTLQHGKDLATRLLFNDKEVFSTSLQGFKHLYFGIWLGDNPLSEDVKKALLKGKL